MLKCQTDKSFFRSSDIEVLNMSLIDLFEVLEVFSLLFSFGSRLNRSKRFFEVLRGF